MSRKSRASRSLAPRRLAIARSAGYDSKTAAPRTANRRTGLRQKTRQSLRRLPCFRSMAEVRAAFVFRKRPKPPRPSLAPNGSRFRIRRRNTRRRTSKPSRRASAGLFSLFHIFNICLFFDMLHVLERERNFFDEIFGYILKYTYFCFELKAQPFAIQQCCND